MKQFVARHSPLFIFATLCAVLAALEPNFRSPDNLKSVLVSACVTGIIAIGQTLVIVAGGIDLSVGSVAALAGVVGGLAMTAWGLPVPAAIALGTLVGLLCGLTNGVLATKARIQPFIATLGMMMAAHGAALLLSGGNTVRGMPRSFAFLGGTGRLEDGTIAWWIPVLITAVIAAVFAVTLTYTRYGRSLFATGGNPTGARLSGIPTDRVQIIAFGIAGLLAGFAGMVLASRTGVASPLGGQNKELEAIAAAVIGGASLMGGEGGVLGTLAGALIMRVLDNFFTLRDYNRFWQDIIVGGLIIALVFYDNMRKRRAGILKG